jgi:hypothetical protein
LLLTVHAFKSPNRPGRNYAFTTRKFRALAAFLLPSLSSVPALSCTCCTIPRKSLAENLPCSSMVRRLAPLRLRFY